MKKLTRTVVTVSLKKSVIKILMMVKALEYLTMLKAHYSWQQLNQNLK